ncbi:hypothetical protein HK097_010693, partial [Rhizophlyctis rosea]
MKGFQPTRRDVSKQTFHQRTLHPSSIGIITTLASANNPNRLYPDAPRAPPNVALQAPTHALLAFRTIWGDPESESSSQSSTSPSSSDFDSNLYAPTPDWLPGSLYFHNSLKPLRTHLIQNHQSHISPSVLRSSVKSLQHTLDEAVSLYRFAAAECANNPIRR